MDFNPRILHAYPGNIPMPYYMTYPGYIGGDMGRSVLQDMEYLQQTYPVRVREYQRKVADILDKLDYEGSMIYDEYPDKYQLQRLAKTIEEMLYQKEALAKMPTDGEVTGKDAKTLQDRLETEYLLQVLICNEICKRRQVSKRRNVWNLTS